MLAENIAAYRVLRRITQDELAMNMTAIGYEMGRSTISAVESLGRMSPSMSYSASQSALV